MCFGDDGQSRGGVLRVRGLLRGSSIAMAWGGGGREDVGSCRANWRHVCTYRLEF